MKKLVLLFALIIATTASVFAQKIALIDTEYILKRIPAFEQSNQELETLSKKWQAEIDVVQKEAQDMYKKYQADLALLTPEGKTKREQQIIDKERQVQDLRKKYFGPEGEMFRRREAMIAPIQEDIYEAVKLLSQENGYQLVMDRASSSGIIFATPKIDISNDVLATLGYSK